MNMKKYLYLFIDETEKHIKSLVSMVGQLKEKKEQEYDKNLINEIFRSFHSIKGMSSALGYNSMADLAHDLEDIFHSCRKNQVNPNKKNIPAITDAIEILYEKLNCIKETESDNIKADSVISQLAGIKTAMGTAETLQISDEIIKEQYHTAIVYFKKIPLALAKAFVLIKRIQTNYPNTKFSPSYEEVKKGKFEGFLKIAGRIDGKLMEFLKEHIEKESYIDRIEYKEFGDRETKYDNTEKISGEISLEPDDKTERKTSRMQKLSPKKIWLNANALDILINRLGQLYINKSIQQKAIQEESRPALLEAFNSSSSLIDRVYNQIIKLRMVPFRTISEEFPFIIKMVSSRQKKNVLFSITGDNIEIDRVILDELKNPLIHILRNAVDHGIETPSERGKRGKDISGHIDINVERKSEFINIAIRDDGMGLDTERIKKRALDLGIINKKEYESIPDNEAIMLITRPGFTMLSKASETSGRGVGMDIVKTTIESLGGRLIINTDRNSFTEFILRVPLTMAIQEVLVVRSQTQEFAFPSRSVLTTCLAHEDIMINDQGSLFLKFNGSLYPAYKIRGNFRFQKDIRIESYPIHAVIVENAPTPNAIIVDRIIETKKAVIKKLPFPFNKYNFLSAVTINYYGEPMLIVDPLRLIRYNLTILKEGA